MRSGTRSVQWGTSVWIAGLALAGLALGIGSADARNGDAPMSFVVPVTQETEVAKIAMPSVDVDAYIQEDEERMASGYDGPVRFAVPHYVLVDLTEAGTLDLLDNGARIWRLRIESPGAFSLNFGFTTYALPAGATVHFYPADQPEGDLYWDGPHTAADAVEQEFWSPVVPGDEVVVELYVPAGAEFEPQLVVGQVNHDYTGFGKLRDDTQQGWCNNDVICPEGDPWRDEIRSEGVYTLNGYWTCSGQLLNSVNPEPPPYFLTANHCGVSTGNDHTMRVYWNYESPQCGMLGGGDLQQSQMGVTRLASYYASDFCLVELNVEPDPEFDVYYSGWDATESNSPGECTAIHHPNCDEKAISFNYDPLTVTSYLGYSVPGDGTHWRVDEWEDGTTEPGSSGSGIWDENHRLVGQLHGGYASCSSITSDWYGRLSRSWTGGGSASNSLQPWLDPGDLGVLVLDGSEPGGSSSVEDDLATRRGGLLPVVPNPAAGSASVRFELTRAARVGMEVVDVTGRIVHQAPVRAYNPGGWQVQWDGVDQDGTEVPAGVYYVRMSIDGKLADSGKIVLVR
ncbi:MAG: hypothetical protein GF355_09470 [Candidatus Eisenbacteria bacterium]|nr:hypothetical protein [Candidatus Eisenbacteria bacterium]